MPKTFNTKKISINPSTVVIHSFLELFEFIPSEFYVEEWQYFCSLNTVIVDAQHRLVRGLPDILAARKANVQNLDAIQVDMSENELVRLINFDNFPSKKEYGVKYKIVCFFDQYLNSDDGKELFDSLQGDLDEKIAEILDCSPSTVQNIRYLGKNDISVFDRIKNGNLGIAQALDAMRAAQKAKGVKPKGGRYGTSVTDVSSFDLSNANLSFPNIGDLQMTVSNKTPIVIFNGQTISGVTYHDQDEIDNGKKKVGSCRYIFQAANAKSSIHIIVNNPDELFK